MAQTNFTPILLYSSSTPTNAPSAGNLTNSTNGSEIAINIADKNLFFKDSGGVVNTVPIRQSSTSSNGWLSSTDWNTFNGKAPATSGTSILYGNGTGGFSNVTIGTGITFAGGTLSATGTGGTVTSVAALTLGTTGTDLSSTVANGTTTPVITLNVPTASASNRGALSSTDWSTFNNKANAFTYTANYIPYGQGTTTPTQSVGLQYNGTTFTTTGISTTNNLAFTGTGNRITGDFSNATLANRVAFQNSVTNGNTTVNIIPNGTSQISSLVLVNDSAVTNGSTAQLVITNAESSFRAGRNGTGPFLPMTLYTNGAEAARIFVSGGVSIGNTTDPGAANLFVNGTIRTLSSFVIGTAANGTTGQFATDNTNNYLDYLGNLTFRTAAASATKMILASSGVVTMSAYGVGTATFSATGVISSVSDETWKIKDGVPVNPDEMLKKLEPGYWFYNKEKALIFGAERQLGFYAQNVNSALGAEAAPTPEDGKPWGYYDRSILAVTVMSLKNALDTIEKLNDKFDAYIASHP